MLGRGSLALLHGDGEAVSEGDGCNEGIGRFDRQAGSAGLGKQLGYRDHGQVERFQRLRLGAATMMGGLDSDGPMHFVGQVSYIHVCYLIYLHQ